MFSSRPNLPIEISLICCTPQQHLSPLLQSFRRLLLSRINSSKTPLQPSLSVPKGFLFRIPLRLQDRLPLLLFLRCFLFWKDNYKFKAPERFFLKLYEWWTTPRTSRAGRRGRSDNWLETNENTTISLKGWRKSWPNWRSSSMIVWLLHLPRRSAGPERCKHFALLDAGASGSCSRTLMIWVR